MNNNFNTVGKPVERYEAALKASGLTEYTADYRPRDLLAIKVLRSPHPHARIRSIDTSQVEALGGVAAVATAADFPPVKIGRWLNDRNVLAQDRVRHVGEAVAAVAAVDEETAEEALELFRVEYEPLPAVFDALQAMAPGAILVHEGLADYAPANRRCYGNVLTSGTIVAGDVEAAFRQSDLVYRDRYITPMGHCGFTQPHQCIASVDPAGKLTVRASTKDPFGLRRQLSDALGISMSRIRVIAGMCGGDFGGKGSTTIEGICACLALKTRKPVKLALNWHEELGGTFGRTAAIVELKAGVKNDGTLLALQGRVVHDCGAYMDAVANMHHDIDVLHGPYRCPNIDLGAFMVYTNNPPTGHVRGVRCPQEAFGIESHMDAMARTLGLDPVELRLRNVMQEGDRLPTGAVLHNVGSRRVLETAADFLKKQPPPPAGAGWGVAMGQYNINPLPGGLKATSAAVRINEDGTVHLLTGSTEQGTGIVTVLQQIVAEELDVPMSMVSVSNADTETSPWERGTGASETTYRVGPTVQMAAQDARDQLLLLAARKLDADPKNLVLAGGRVFIRPAAGSSAVSAPGEGISIKDLAREASASTGGPILGTGLARRNERFRKMEAVKGEVDGPSYGVAAVQVKVDAETGEVKVLKAYSVWDAGFAINPSNVEGQIEGGVACGIGYALAEELVLRNGKTLNNSIVNYHMPTAADVPMVKAGIVEVPSGFGPYGAKGIGEATNTPVAPAVVNAVCAATGVRITELPLKPERVAEALRTRP